MLVHGLNLGDHQLRTKPSMAAGIAHLRWDEVLCWHVSFCLWFNGVNPPCFWVNCRIRPHRNFTPKFKQTQMVFFVGRKTQFLEFFQELGDSWTVVIHTGSMVGSLVWWLTCPNRSPSDNPFHRELLGWHSPPNHWLMVCPAHFHNTWKS